MSSITQLEALAQTLRETLAGLGLLRTRVEGLERVEGGGGNRIFHVGMNSNQTITANNSWVKVIFDNIVIDDGSHYDSINYRWTPPAGKVRIHAIVQIYNVNANGMIVAIYKNGVKVAENGSRIDTTGTHQSMSISYTDNSNGTDYYEIFNYRWDADIIINAGPGSYFDGICFPS